MNRRWACLVDLAKCQSVKCQVSSAKCCKGKKQQVPCTSQMRKKRSGLALGSAARAYLWRGVLGRVVPGVGYPAFLGGVSRGVVDSA